MRSRIIHSVSLVYGSSGRHSRSDILDFVQLTRCARALGKMAYVVIGIEVLTRSAGDRQRRTMRHCWRIRLWRRRCKDRALESGGVTHLVVDACFGHLNIFRFVIKP